MNRTFNNRRFSAVALTLLLMLSFAAFAPAQSSAKDGYVVEWGDTLSGIAERYGISMEQLIALNGIDDPNLIITGQFLQMTKGSGEILQGGPQPADEVADDSAQVESAAPEHGDASETWALVNSGELPPAFDREQVRDLLIDAAHRYGWDPYLIMAQAWQESYWSQNELSWTGAVGVMQVMPDTAAEMESWYFGYELNTWYSAYDNIEMGVAYLTVLYNETGSVENALASYYQGWGSLQRDGWFPDTEEYVQRIFRFREMFAAGETP
jgi:murein DD-endopeptidase MepM/ murein hydrolase activator NlpD